MLFRHSQHGRFCHASATLLAFWSIHSWFKCSPKVGVAILDSRTTSERFHAHVIEELRAIFQLVIVPKLYPSVCGLSWKDPEPCGPLTLSCLDLIIQHNMSVVHNGQLKHSDFSASIVDIQLDINQLNFRLYIERIQKSLQKHSSIA